MVEEDGMLGRVSSLLYIKFAVYVSISSLILHVVHLAASHRWRRSSEQARPVQHASTIQLNARPSVPHSNRTTL